MSGTNVLDDEKMYCSRTANTNVFRRTQLTWRQDNQPNAKKIKERGKKKETNIWKRDKIYRSHSFLGIVRIFFFIRCVTESANVICFLFVASILVNCFFIFFGAGICAMFFNFKLLVYPVFLAPWRPMRSLEKPLETHHSRWLCFVLRNLSRSRRNSWSEAPKGVGRMRRAQSVLVHSSPCCGDYKTKWPCRRYINKRKEKRENRIEIFKFLCGATIKKRPPDLNFFFFWDRGLLFSSKMESLFYRKSVQIIIEILLTKWPLFLRGFVCFLFD